MPTLSIAGIMQPSHSIAREPSAKLETLAQHWFPIFSQIQTNEDEIHAFVAKFVKPWDLSDVPPPHVDNFQRTIDVLQDCGVGPDGLAYSAWNSEGGADTLCLLSQDLACDVSPALSFNDSLTAFLKKGNLAEDLEEVIRAPEATRPLGLRNSDNKIVAATCNRQWRRKLNDVVCSIQRGFCWSRQMLENIVDVDSLARILGCEGYEAFIALFDFCCAFPSLGHVFLFAMLKAKGFPEGFICIVKQLYRHCCSFGSSGDVCQFLWFITCGVLQGCPLSGLIFSVMMDPFCVAFLKFETRCNSEAKRPLTCIRAFADDVGAVIHSLKSLKHIKGIFDAAAKYANLSLKLVKCYLVPVFCACNEETRAAVKK